MKFIAAVAAASFLAAQSLPAETVYREEMPMHQQTSVKEMTLQFAQLFTEKNAEAIGSLLTDSFSLYDPALKWVKGKDAVVDVLKKQFKETNHVSYEVVNAYEEGNTGVLEFKITLDDLVLNGVDFIQWENGQMKELRCYYNQPVSETLKPFSARAKTFAPGQIFEHYKGKRYKILSVARHSESLEETVIYEALYGDHDVWARPIGMFFETIEWNGKTLPRFKKLS